MSSQIHLTYKHWSSVPRFLLEETGRGTSDPFEISDYTHGKNKRIYFRIHTIYSLHAMAAEPGMARWINPWPQHDLLTSSLEIFETILGMRGGVHNKARLAANGGT